MTVIEKVSDIKNLRKAWASLKSGKSDDARRVLRGIDGLSISTFQSQEDINLKKISEALISNTYTMEPIKAFFFRKQNKREYRLICPPSIPDAIVHAAILIIIKPYFLAELNIGVSYSGVPSITKKTKVNHITALKNLHIEFIRGNYHVFESDIKGFFDSIKKKNLLQKLKTSLPDTTINSLIRQIIYFKIGNYDQLKKEGKGKLPPLNSKVGIAQGSPLSPFFANVYMSKIDLDMKQAAGGRFFRYVDDFIIVAPTAENAATLGAEITALLKSHSLLLAPDKTSQCNVQNKTEAFNFLGLKISRFEVRQKKKEKDVLSIIESDYLNTKKYKKKHRTLTFQERVNARIQGYANYYRSFHTQPVLTSINQLIQKKRKQLKAFRYVELVDASGKKQFMSKEKWQSAFIGSQGKDRTLPFGD